MSAIRNKWTEKIKCSSVAEAQVKKEELRRKGMIARIARRPARYRGGVPQGGYWLVKGRVPKRGPNQQAMNTDELPLVIVKIPMIVEQEVKRKKLDENGNHEKDWKGVWQYETEMVKRAVIQEKAMRIAPEDIPAFVAEAQEKVDSVLNPSD